MILRIEQLVDQMVALRADNDSLRSELQTALEQLERANASLGDGAGPRRGRERERRRRGAAPRSARGRGRATPDGVTADVVKAVIAKLGPSTAADIAAEIGRFGEPVSGRAVRFLAEKAGAQTMVIDGRRLYRL